MRSRHDLGRPIADPMLDLQWWVDLYTLLTALGLLLGSVLA